jgi:hypothetical protein
MDSDDWQAEGERQVIEAAVVPYIEIARGELRHDILQPARHKMDVGILGQVARCAEERLVLSEKEEH